MALRVDERDIGVASFQGCNEGSKEESHALGIAVARGHFSHCSVLHPGWLNNKGFHLARHLRAATYIVCWFAL